LSVESFETCRNLQAQQAIKTFDEKLETQKFKFGIIYQRKGQVILLIKSNYLPYIYSI